MGFVRESYRIAERGGSSSSGCSAIRKMERCDPVDGASPCSNIAVILKQKQGILR